MQSMFRLASWGTEAPGDKIMEKATLHKSRPVPVVDIPNFMSKTKRKRTDSPEPASPQHAHVLKKWKNAQGEVKPAVLSNAGMDRAQVVDGVVASPVFAESQEMSKAASADIMEARPIAQPSRKEGAAPKTSKPRKTAAKSESCVNAPTPTMDTDLTRVQQAIEAQFNYEILLKHNELRLIEQELAKCQVSLEQLRRCSLIPYPGTEGLSLDVSGGIGPALQPPSGYTEPEHPAPWGVMDGPYTRHYAKWLIPDPKFDPMPERASAQQSQGYFGVGEGRTTRGSFAEFGSTGRARTSRTSTGTLKLQVLGENPPPAPKIDPLLHKRSTDGQWVRLFCDQCGHSNFSNTQGFLNHCRIKHSQVFKSHDQAAIACGVPVDMDESGNPVSATEPPSTTATTPIATFPVLAAPGTVHPLIRTNPGEFAKDVHRDFSKPLGDRTKPSAPASKPDFTTAASTPYLNSLLAKSGFAGDFQGLVNTAQMKVDLSSMESESTDIADDEGSQTPVVSQKPQQARLPTTTTAAPTSKSSSARSSSLSSRPSMPSHVKVGGPVPVNSGYHTPGSPVELSPNTVESNPGLVSDHDDDDDEDGYDARSQPDMIMDDADDVVVEDASDVEGVRERTGSRKRLEGCFEKGEGSRKH